MVDASQRTVQIPAGGIVFVAIGIATTVGLRDLSWLGDGGVVGPAAFPGACGILLGLLGIVQIATALLAGRREPAPVAAGAGAGDGSDATDAEPEGSAEPEGAHATALQAVLAWAGVLVASIALPRIGLVITVPLLSLFLLIVVGKKRVLVAVIYSLILTVVLYLLFVVALKVPLPVFPWMV